MDINTGSTELELPSSTPPDELHDTIATEPTELWEKNEQLFMWMITGSGSSENWLLLTVPGGGKSHVKENLIPKISHLTGQTFVLVTTEYRNRRETLKNIHEAIEEAGLSNAMDVVYIPSAREPLDPLAELQSCSSSLNFPDSDSDAETETVCQTFSEMSDENDSNDSYNMTDDVYRYVRTGATTGTIHYEVLKQNYDSVDEEFTGHLLPCQQTRIENGYEVDPYDKDSEPPCRWRRMSKRARERVENDSADIVICGASALYQSELVEGATVILDEDVAGELVDTKSSDYYETSIGNYLSHLSNEYNDDLPGTLKRLNRSNRDQGIPEYVRDDRDLGSQSDDDSDSGSIVHSGAPLDSDCRYDCAEAPLFTLAAAEGEVTEETDFAVFHGEDVPYTVVEDLKTDAGGDSYDPVAVAKPPQALAEAEQVIALDATGSAEWWELITGVEIDPVSPTPRDKQGTVVTEAFNIKFRQATDNMVTINKPNRVSSREFLGILQAITDEHNADEISIVTSKQMKEKALESHYADQIRELAYKDTILHFGALRSDRTFEESDLHVVVGSPHPGDAPVRRRMALLGYDDEIVQGDSAFSGENRFRGTARTVLENMVNADVYQAARRAARDTDRDEPAYVYLYTRMFNDTDIEIEQTCSIDIFGKHENTSGATEAIASVLENAERWPTTQEVHKRVNKRLDDSLSENRLREKLDEMTSGNVDKIPIPDSHRWKINDEIKSEGGVKLQHGILRENQNETGN